MFRYSFVLPCALGLNAAGTTTVGIDGENFRLDRKFSRAGFKWRSHSIAVDHLGVCIAEHAGVSR